MRRGDGSAPPTPTRGSMMPAVAQAIGHQRHGDREIADAAAEFVEAAPRIGRQQRQPDLGQQFVLGQRRRHDALEEVGRRRSLGVPRCAHGHHFGAEGRGRQAPFGGRVGMCEAAAEGAAGTDRMMRDIAAPPPSASRRADHRPPADRTRRGARRRRSPDAVGMAPMRPSASTPLMSTRCAGPRQPERHGGDQALPACQDAAVLGRELRQQATASSTVLGAWYWNGAGFIGETGFPVVSYFGTMNYF